MFKNYTMRLLLTNFIGARVIDFENEDGISEKGVFIPFEMNGLHETERGNVAAHFFVTERMTATKDGSSHYVKLKMPKEYLDRLNNLGYETPFVGSMRHSSIKPSYQIDYEKGGGKVRIKDYFNKE